MITKSLNCRQFSAVISPNFQSSPIKIAQCVVSIRNASFATKFMVFVYVNFIIYMAHEQDIGFMRYI